MALAVAERVRAHVTGSKVDIGGKTLVVRASVGAATLTAGCAGQEPANLVRAADAALYRAKQAGRDRVCQALPEDLAPAPSQSATGLTTGEPLSPSWLDIEIECG